jgi:hypothetical protein
LRAGFDNNPGTKDILGEEGFKKFLPLNEEAFEVTDAVLYLFNAQLNNPPDDVAVRALAFWHLKSPHKYTNRVAGPGPVN